MYKRTENGGELMQIIKEKRKAKKLTQKELASITGLSQSSIHNYENKKRSPRLNDLDLIAKALECDVCELLFDKS